MQKIIAERVDRWKKKLIDLTKRNRLINFRATKVSTIRIVDEQPPEVFATLVAEAKSMDFLPLPEEKEEEQNNDTKKTGKKEGGIEVQTKEFEKYDREKLAGKHTDIHLQTNLSKEQLAKNLFRIHSSATSVMEEQGYNVLFLAIGFLEWYEASSSDIKIKSPLLLIPVELSRPSIKGAYKVKYNEDSILMNPALRQKIHLDFGININDLEDDIDKINLLRIFSDIQKKIENKERWRVTNDIFLGLFSFAKFMMYKDLEHNLKGILSSEIIQTICGQESRKRESLDSLCSWEELKGLIKSQKTFQVLDADSSQQRAIAIVKKENNLVIEGPPGTGKSQTIANIIAELLAEEKKVLFVSQKMAALEVVKKRLKAVGLGNFCLELHSRKANKKRVIEELAENLKNPQSPDHKHDKDLLKLERVKEELSTYVKEVGTPFGELGMTPYKAMGIIASMSGIPDIAFIFKDVEKWDEKKLDLGYELLGKLSKNLIHINNPSLHPWYGSRLTELSYQEKLKVKELMDAAYEAHLKLQNSIQQLTKASCFREANSYKKIDEMLDGTNVLIALPSTAIELLNNSNWHEISNKMEDILNNVKNFINFRKWANDKFDLSIFEKDVDKLYEEYKQYVSKFFYFFSSSFRKNRRVIKKHKIRQYKPKLQEIVSGLAKICDAKKWAKNINSYNELGEKLFGKLWHGRDSDGEALVNSSNWIKKFHEHTEEKHFSENIFIKAVNKEFNLTEIKTLRENIIKDRGYYRNIVKELIQSVKLDVINGIGKELDEILLEMLDRKIKGMKESIDDIDSWLAYQNSLEDCETFGFEDFLNACKKHNISHEDIPSTYKCQFLRCWLDAVFFERKTLKQFLGINHEQLIEQFRELDSKQIELARARLRHRLSGKVDTSWEGASGSERGILEREARKKRAHKPLRKLFKAIPNLLCELKPCLMMSPLTVAQLLDTTLFKFDLVIFDEASQIPPEDGIGAIIRGKRVVVAGDTKQLPPTSFFQSAVLTPEDDNEELDGYIPMDDLDSILDECATSGFPECMLMWHYRSRHEYLIAFSNKHLYGNNLYTFPNSEHESDILGIKFHYFPDTHYERGKVGANFDEAREVAKAVFKHFRKYPDKSLGIGTFSVRQKFAIEDAIEELRKQDTSLEEYFMEDKEEHFFIKNLETIQGDERDVIFISIGYGKNQSGNLPMNFGPLNQLGGERRLNVLITRARYRVEIFSSIRGGDFDLSRTNSEGVHLLKKYLDFAEKGKIVLAQGAEKPEEIADSPFEEAVYDALTRKGIKVRKQIGCSGYKIDLAVVDKDSPGEFLLGIECDGATYHSSKTARDRDRLRQQVLEQLGWNLYRIWSTDWFKNPKQELNKVLNAIERVREGSFKKKVLIRREYEIDYISPDQKENSQSKQALPYEITPITRRRSSDDFYYYASTEDIAKKLKLVVETEGPIHKDEAMRRVSQFWGFGSVGSRIRDRLHEVVTYSRKKSLIKTKDDFYWPKGMINPTIRSREGIKGISKKIASISPEEIGEAAVLALSKEYGMPMNDLINQAAKILGYRRVTEDTRRYIGKSIDKYKNSGFIIEKGGSLILVNKANIRKG